MFFGEEGRIEKFLPVFWCLEEREKCVEKQSKEQNSKKMWSLVWGMPRANIAPGENFEKAALQRPSKSVDLGTSRNILAS